MATPPAAPPYHGPRFLKATYLADREFLLEETRGTALFYFPGPIFWLIVLLFLLYTATSARFSGLPAVPYLTSLFARAPSIAGYAGSTYVLLVFLVLTIIVLFWLLVRYLRWISIVYAVTTHRVILQKGIFSKEFDEIPLAQVRGVDVRQSFFQRALGYGTVRVSAEEGHGLGNEDWRGIPHPFKFQKIIENATQNLTMAAGGVVAYPPPAYPPPSVPPPR